ncbi:hypothetical protein [Nitrosomonas ureae]|uniref:hypothetical protein n=1 Tax=Nitrosomonas ureae TaxID=44577 RepID=UPI0020D157E9|nr:hypothetical protein [Nitrosomonas ureae]
MESTLTLLRRGSIKNVRKMNTQIKSMKNVAGLYVYSMASDSKGGRKKNAK